MIIHKMEQRSEAWLQVRAGKITSTSFPTMANGRAATIESLCRKAASQRLSGKPEEGGYTNAAMDNGIAMEDVARRAYEVDQFVHVRQVGFIELDEYIGVSPDGLVGDDGGVEIKCPQQTTHLDYLLDRTGAKDLKWIPSKYRWQIQGALWVTGRQWWDFVSYYPYFQVKTQLLVERITPDDNAFASLEKGAAYCRERIAAIVEAVNGNA